MRRPSSAVAGIVAVLTIAATTGCAGTSAGERVRVSAASTAAATPAAPPAPTTGTAPTRPVAPAVPASHTQAAAGTGEPDTAFCAALTAGTALLEQPSADLDLATTLARIDALRSTAPPELQGDVRTVGDLLARKFPALEESAAGAVHGIADPGDDLLALYPAFYAIAMQTPEFRASLDRLLLYRTQRCP